MNAFECEYCNGEIRSKKVTVNPSSEGKLVITFLFSNQCGKPYRL